MNPLPHGHEEEGSGGGNSIATASNDHKLFRFRFFQIVEGFYFFSRQGAVVDADVVDGADPVLIMKSRKTDK